MNWTKARRARSRATRHRKTGLVKHPVLGLEWLEHRTLLSGGVLDDPTTDPSIVGPDVAIRQVLTATKQDLTTGSNLAIGEFGTNTATLTIPEGVTADSRPVDPLTVAAVVIGADQHDPDASNDAASVVEAPQRADLDVAVVVSDPAPNVGDTITFLVTLTDRGPAAASNVVLSQLLPGGLSYVSSIPGQGIYNPDNGLWMIGPVATGAGATLQITARVTGPGMGTVQATVLGDQFDPVPANNVARITETPQQADLAVTNAVSNPTPVVGDTITSR